MKNQLATLALVALGSCAFEPVVSLHRDGGPGDGADAHGVPPPKDIRIPEQAGINPEGIVNSRNVQQAPVDVDLPDTCPADCDLRVAAVSSGQEVSGQLPVAGCPGTATVTLDLTRLDDGRLELRARLVCSSAESQDATATARKDTQVAVSVDPLVTPTDRPSQLLTGRADEDLSLLRVSSDRFPAEYWEPTWTGPAFEVQLRLKEGTNNLTVHAEDRVGNATDLDADFLGGPLSVEHIRTPGPLFLRDESFPAVPDPDCSGVLSAVRGNDDDRPEIFLSGCGQLYLSRPDGSYVLQDLSQEVRGDRAAVWTDLDQDGHQDLAITDYRTDPALRVYQITWLADHVTVVEHDLSSLISNPEGAAWLAWDDALPPELWVQDGTDNLLVRFDDFSATDISDQAGLTNDRDENGSWVAALDFDRDGDVDVFVADTLVRAYVQEAGRFEERDGSLGILLHRDNDHKWPLVFGDVDGDGKFDLWAVEPANTQKLYVWNGQTFEDQAPQAGLSFPAGPAAALGDVDNDGDLDLVAIDVSNDPAVLVVAFSELGPPLGYRIVRTDITFGLDGLPTSMLLEDVDGDGDLDLLVAVRGQGLTIYRNTSTCPETDTFCAGLGRHVNLRSLRVRPAYRTTGGQLLPVPGTVVEVREPDPRGRCSRAGRLMGARFVEGADGAGGQHSSILHFGGLAPSRQYCVFAILPPSGTVHAAPLLPSEWLGKVFVLSN